MAKAPGAPARGGSFTPAEVAAVWLKAKATTDDNWRQDACGAWIKWQLYGKCEEYGWEIDHILAVANGGTDAATNLQALHWLNNRHKGDNAKWSCAVKSSGNTNVDVRPAK